MPGDIESIRSPQSLCGAPQLLVPVGASSPVTNLQPCSADTPEVVCYSGGFATRRRRSPPWVNVAFGYMWPVRSRLRLIPGINLRVRCDSGVGCYRHT